MFLDGLIEPEDGINLMHQGMLVAIIHYMWHMVVVTLLNPSLDMANLGV